MSWIEDKEDFNNGIKAYFMLFIPELILILNIPLYYSLIEYLITQNIEIIYSLKYNYISNTVFTLFFVLFFYRLYWLQEQIKNKYQKEFIGSHLKYIAKNTTKYTLVIILYPLTIYTAMVFKDNQFSDIKTIENIVIALTTIVIISVTVIILKNIRGFLNFMNQLEPNAKLFKKQNFFF